VSKISLIPPNFNDRIEPPAWTGNTLAAFSSSNVYVVAFHQFDRQHSTSAGVSLRAVARIWRSASAVAIWPFAANAKPRAKRQNALVIAMPGLGAGSART